MKKEFGIIDYDALDYELSTKKRSELLKIANKIVENKLSINFDLLKRNEIKDYIIDCYANSLIY